MAKHQNRQAVLLTSYSCKQGGHGAVCASFLAELGNTLVCHCDCHSPCGRPACQVAAARAPQSS